MSTDALDRAYDLIKAGDTSAAIDLLEPIIRADRDNEDAWWLLANATTDPESRRNALNNVLRISTNDLRREKAESLLAQLDADRYEFDLSEPSFAEDSAAYPAPRQPEGGTGWSCGRIAITMLGVVGLCACVACFGLFAAGQALGETFITVPDNVDQIGLLADGEAITESVTEERWDAFTLQGERGERIRVRVTNDSLEEPAPFIFLYDPNDDILTFGDEISTGSTTLNFNLPETGEYTVVVRTFFGFGTGEYTIEMNRR